MIGDRLDFAGTPVSGFSVAYNANATPATTPLALRQAAVSGGYVSLGVGTFDLSGAALEITGGTVIQGAGIGKTFLLIGGQYGPTDTPANGQSQIVYLGGNIALVDLTIVNISRSLNPMAIFYSAGLLPNIVWDRIEIDAGDPQEWGFAADGWLVRDCRLNSRGDAPGFAGRNGLLTRTTCVYTGNRTRFNYLSDSKVIGNYFRLCGTRAIDKESGGTELTFVKNVVFENNWVVSDGQGVTSSSGELLTSQISNVPDWYDVGTVVSVSGTTLVTSLRRIPSGVSFYAPNHLVTDRKAVFVQDGAGAGQWRWISELADGSYSMDRPFVTPPAAGDRIGVSSVAAYQAKINNNVFIGGSVGIQLYSGALECEANNNLVQSSGGIWFRAVATPSSQGSRFLPVWDCKISGNTISEERPYPPVSGVSVNSVEYWTNRPRAASLLLVANGTDGLGLPLMVKSTVVTKNKIYGTGHSFPEYSFGREDGISLEARIENGQGLSIAGMIDSATSVYDNNLINCTFTSTR